MKILETNRLVLRTFTMDDAPFYLALVNEPGWLRFIGNRGLSQLEETRTAILTGPVAMYERLGFCLYVVEQKTGVEANTSIGICGLIKRDQLDDVDLGFAFLAEYGGYGYALEAAQATMDYANSTLGLKRVVAITSPDNISSIKLLQKIGFKFEKMMTFKSTNPDAPDTQLFGYEFN